MYLFSSLSITIMKRKLSLTLSVALLAFCGVASVNAQVSTVIKRPREVTSPAAVVVSRHPRLLPHRLFANETTPRFSRCSSLEESSTKFVRMTWSLWTAGATWK